MCGFVGLIATTDVAPEIHLALQALQHRGQDSAGIAVMSADGGAFHMRRGLGTAANALTRSDLDALTGPVGVGHVRYPTIGKGVLDDAQPFFYRVPGVLMAHNGNVTNYSELREDLRSRSIHLMSHCDVEPAMCEFADALMARRRAQHTLEDATEAAREVLERVRGAYSIVAALTLDGEPTLMVLRDRRGVRPCVVGRMADGAWIAASESVALDLFEAVDRFEPDPGEVVFLKAGQAPIRRRLAGDSAAPCIFEFIYFARPDAVMSGHSVYEMRLSLGRLLAQRVRAKGLAPDVVIPVPDTARPAATAAAEELSLPLREGFIKNRYSGRTFIMPDAVTRQAALRLKLNVIPAEIADRSVLLVDDSIVRGATLARVIALVRRAGAREVHLAIHSPPVTSPCFYGIDMSTEEELFANRYAPDLETMEHQAAADLDADTLTYLDVSGVDVAFGKGRCAACFDGAYPLPLPDSDRASVAGERRDVRGG